MNTNNIKYIDQHIYYLNMIELTNICKKFNIDYQIYIEKEKNIFVKTNDKDVKKTLIKKIITYIKTSKRLPRTTYKHSVIKFEPVPQSLKKTDVCYYGQYKNGNQIILSLMKKLTDNKFKFGAISCDILKTAWSQNKKITYQHLANKWMSIHENTFDHPEWAFIDFVRSTGSNQNWKKVRNDIAKKIMKLIDQQL